MQNGKGSKQRPTDYKKYGPNFDSIFRKTQKQKLVEACAKVREVNGGEFDKAIKHLSAQRVDNVGVHITHCCILHGCKYGDKNCPVELGEEKQDGLCLDCDFMWEKTPEEKNKIWEEINRQFVKKAYDRYLTDFYMKKGDFPDIPLTEYEFNNPKDI